MPVVPAVSDEEPLGPRPVRSTPGGPVLDGTRARTLDVLAEADGPLTIPDVAAILGAHDNSARAHLDALVESGFATRSTQQTGGRGRPRYQYSITDDGLDAHRSQIEPDALTAEYQGLLRAFAQHINDVQAEPEEFAREIGERWGATLAGESDDPARQQVLTLLRRLGFTPVETPSTEDAVTPLIELRTCPLLDLAVEHPEVICNVHVGLIRGALHVAGGTDDDVVLTPFAAPGACHLHLP